jgi:peptidoglycan hydrolase-like protein with peptidoglycan-binding domain
MALQSVFWNANLRLQRAVVNHTSMRQGEPDHAAVKLLQQALAKNGMGAIKPDGIFGPKTASAVRAVESRFHMTPDPGMAGTQTLGILDILLQNGKLGRDLALTDVPLATRKVKAAVAALTAFQANLGKNVAQSQLTVDALATHFRLTVVRATIGVTRVVTAKDLTTMLGHYTNLLNLFHAAATRFRTGVPVNGILIAAEAPLGGPIRFGPAFTDVDSHFGARIGPNSRAAILIHEGVHVFDAESGRDDTHISEFEPGYATQDADRSLHNPSSYAGFAAHIANNGDPSPRFGLGPGARGL